MIHHSQQPVAAWHSLGLDDVLQQLDVSEHGLGEGQAAVRLSQYGPNTLPLKPPAALWQIVLRQFRSPLIYILVLQPSCPLRLAT